MHYTAVGFDLGDTLICYRGVPQSWATLYREALSSMAMQCDYLPSPTALNRAEGILHKYNTRLNPRVYEVQSEQIISEILAAWQLGLEYFSIAESTFFSFFQMKLEVYPDTISILQYLKSKGIKVGILTDTPYGMNTNYVLGDIAQFSSYIDVLLTSTDVGYRKPAAFGYEQLCRSLGTSPNSTVYVGNEHKDIEGANKAGLYSILLDREQNLPNWGESLRIVSLDGLRAFL